MATEPSRGRASRERFPGRPLLDKEQERREITMRYSVQDV